MKKKEQYRKTKKKRVLNFMFEMSVFQRNIYLRNLMYTSNILTINTKMTSAPIQ